VFDFRNTNERLKQNDLSGKQHYYYDAEWQQMEMNCHGPKASG
jgi:hypothetical protein